MEARLHEKWRSEYMVWNLWEHDIKKKAIEERLTEEEFLRFVGK